MAWHTITDDLGLYVEDRGTGPPIVFVHAWSLDHRMFENQVAMLGGRFRTIAYDQRGHGRSDKPDASYAIDAFTDDLEHLLRGLDLNDVTLLGWSMGTTVCLDYMRRSGERVAKLCLVSGGPYLVLEPDWPHGFDMAVVQAMGQRLFADRAQTTREFYGSLLHAGTSDATIDRVLRTCLEVPLAIALASFQSELAQDLRPVLPTIRVPTLVIGGAHDHPAGIGGCRYMAEKIPGAQLVVLERSAHFPMLEEPEAFTQALAAFAG